MGEDAAAEALRRAREMAGGPAGAKKRRRTTEPGGLSAGPGLGNAGSGARPSARDPQRVGDAVADHTTVERFEEGTLVVRASSTAWATQVKLLLGQLRQRIAAEVGPDLVTEIVILGPAGPTWKHGLRSVRGRGPRDTYG